MKYFLRDLGNGFGTFVKITGEIVLKDNSLIHIGDSYIVCSLGIEEEILISENDMKLPSSASNNTYSNLLNLKIFSGNAKYDPINFQPSKSAIKIGRSLDNEVVIDDNMLSRVHCTIEHKNPIGWVIQDGHFTKNHQGQHEVKHSTNGTW